MNGLSAHIGNIHKMMSRANCEDRFAPDACTKSTSLEDLSAKIMDEMEAIAPCGNYKQCKKTAMEELTKIKIRQQAIAFEMLQDINNLSLDQKALKARMISYRRQIANTTAELGKAITSLDKDATVPIMEILG
jgi:hypothetical protein